MSQNPDPVKYLTVIVLLVVIGAWLQGQTVTYRIERTLTSPSGSATAFVAAQDTKYGQIFSLGGTKNGVFQPFTQLPNPVYRREYHGSDWFQTMPEHWLDDRFLVFEDAYGLVIADVQNEQMLVDHVFTGYAKSPTANEWAAIRFRPTTRTQEQLTGDFQDTLLLIDPKDAAAHIREVSDSNFVGQLKAVKPGGVLLAPPEWSPDGSAFGVLTWKQGAVEAVRYDANLNEIARVPVNIQVDHDTALSLSFKPELAQRAKKILSDPTIFP
jgi:hypothetical protein